MRILGLDPGTAITGFGIIEGTNSGDKKHLAHGQIKTPKNLPDEDRLQLIEKDLKELIKRTKPDYAAIEKIFFHKNVTTAISVAQARGVLLLILKNHHQRPEVLSIVKNLICFSNAIIVAWGRH